MKIKNYLLRILTIVLLSNAYTLASAENLDGVTMKITQDDVKRGHRVPMRAHHIILNYMLKNGDITQDEIDEEKQKRTLNRMELKRLKKSGDKEVFKTRLKEIKQEHDENRKKIKNYIDSHKDLEEILHAKHKERREKDAKPGDEKYRDHRKHNGELSELDRLERPDRPRRHKDDDDMDFN